jgi:hypothetical protein
MRAGFTRRSFMANSRVSPTYTPDETDWIHSPSGMNCRKITRPMKARKIRNRVDAMGSIVVSRSGGSGPAPGGEGRRRDGPSAGRGSVYVRGME